jgi:hypothetical protein
VSLSSGLARLCVGFGSTSVGRARRIVLLGCLLGGADRGAVGEVDGAAMSLLFAAAYPERTFGLVLWQPKPRFVRAPDYPWAPTREGYERETAEVEFEPRGMRKLKGLGEWPVFAVVSV